MRVVPSGGTGRRRGGGYGATYAWAWSVRPQRVPTGGAVMRSRTGSQFLYYKGWDPAYLSQLTTPTGRRGRQKNGIGIGAHYLLPICSALVPDENNETLLTSYMHSSILHLIHLTHPSHSSHRLSSCTDGLLISCTLTISFTHAASHVLFNPALPRSVAHAAAPHLPSF